jgi:hypothetical protein
MFKSLLFLQIALLLVCCSPTTKTVSVLKPSTPLPSTTIVEVVGMGQKIENATLLGHVKIGDGNTKSSNCTYDKVIADAQNQARGMGGNLIQITKHKEPDQLVSTCHRLWADVYLKK